MFLLIVKTFFKLWSNEELELLKKDSVESNRLWKAAGKPRSGQIFNIRQTCRARYRSRIKEREKFSTEFYTNELHEAFIM